MDDIDLSDLFKDEDNLLKAVGLAYLALGLYFGFKTKPISKREVPSFKEPAPRTSARTLSDMIRTMMEEAYGIPKEPERR